MRSVVSASMTTVLDHLGLLDTFDDVYGSSAGALIGAYFVAGQAAIAPSIYYENLCCSQFVNPWRLLRRRPAMSLDYLFDVIERVKPLNWEAIVASKIRFHPLVTSLTEGGLRDLHAECATVQDLRLALRATSVLPVVAGPPAEVRGHRCVDAGLFESFPFGTATRDGCTHVLVLRTRPEGRAPADVSRRQRFFLRHGLRVERDLLHLLGRRRDRYIQEGLDLFEAVRGVAPASSVYALAPAEEAVALNRLSSNTAAIRVGAMLGVHAVRHALRIPDAVMRVTP